ncbi:M24 family metallopeptidase [Hyphococcus flavus]|uniref:M24 family metallopeptidase n=1 Tax=Hyphococcus flavus TaxID=1866326 RepID=A0AAE9ZCE3_9PROT|nr:M24 family metallopeptidase [Hyphococcus flavus]WDI32318.1 M24 family metallopeptidase [Hyphococcus flavus]
MCWKQISAALAILTSIPTAWAQSWDQGRVITGDRAVLQHRERPAVENAIVDDRLKTLLPQLMDETGIDMWLVINREYAEDPIYFTLVPQPTFAARRTTMLVFHRHNDELDMLTINRYPLGESYAPAWQGGELDEQWAALGALIAEKNPDKIGVNMSRDWPIADGLTHGLYQRLVSVLTPELQQRLTSAETLVVRWAETRNRQETEIYGHVVGLARMVIGEAFSSEVITPGVTTTDDVAWYIRQRFEDLNLAPWFMPYVNIQRPGLACEEEQAFCGERGVIRRGDVLHTDVGICYLKLCTDTQEMGYVANLGEQDAPKGLKAALRVGNRWQDHLTSSFEVGLTGNQILAQTHEKCRKGRMICSTYTHPIGFVGHAPGPTIGMWDNQGETPVRGDWPLYPDTCYAIEGNVKASVSEWNDQLVQIKLEQSACYDGEKVRYLAGRQTQWHVIK